MKFINYDWMKFWCIFYKTALHVAAEEGHAEIIKLLLSNPKIDVNLLNILKINF